MTPIFIVGSGGFAKDVIWLLEEINQLCPDSTKGFEVLGLVSADPSLPEVGGLPVLGDDEWAIQHLSRDVQFVVAMGNPGMRARLSHAFEQQGFTAATLIHPRAAYGRGRGPGGGTMICAGVTISLETDIGQHVILNLNCTVGHDVIIEDFVTVSPGANISGNVHLETSVEIGSGAVVLPGVRVGANAILGAGAVALNDLEPDATYVGIPARRIR